MEKALQLPPELWVPIILERAKQELRTELVKDKLRVKEDTVDEVLTKIQSTLPPERVSETEERYLIAKLMKGLEKNTKNNSWVNDENNGLKQEYINSKKWLKYYRDGPRDSKSYLDRLVITFIEMVNNIES